MRTGSCGTDAAAASSCESGRARAARPAQGDPKGVDRGACAHDPAPAGCGPQTGAPPCALCDQRLAPFSGPGQVRGPAQPSADRVRAAPGPAGWRFLPPPVCRHAALASDQPACLTVTPSSGTAHPARPLIGDCHRLGPCNGARLDAGQPAPSFAAPFGPRRRDPARLDAKEKCCASAPFREVSQVDKRQGPVGCGLGCIELQRVGSVWFCCYLRLGQ